MKEEFDFDIGSYKEEVLEEAKRKFASTSIRLRYLAMEENLQWAKEFMDAYERKHKNVRIRK